MAQGIEIIVDLLASGTRARGRQCSTVKSSVSIKRVMILAATLCCPPGRPGHMLQLQDLAEPEAPASPQQLSPQAEASMTIHARGGRSLTATTTPPPPTPPATLRCRPSGTSGPDPSHHKWQPMFVFVCVYMYGRAHLPHPFLGALSTQHGDVAEQQVDAGQPLPCTASGWSQANWLLLLGPNVRCSVLMRSAGSEMIRCGADEVCR